MKEKLKDILDDLEYALSDIEWHAVVDAKRKLEALLAEL